MKTKLFTQNSFFVMIMTLVLTLGMQDIADALTFSTSRSGDLATELPTPNDFDIRFSVSLKGNTSIKDANGNLVDEDDNQIDSSGYFIAGDPLVRTPVGGEDKPTNAKRYHYNQEQVTITATNAAITHIGRYDIPDVPAGTSHSLMETGEDGSKLTSSITVTLSAASPETVVITIADETPVDDLPNGAADRAPSITFTVYVVPGTSDEDLTLTGTGTDGVETRDDFGPTRIDNLFNVADADNVPLIYEVTGSGRVFVQAGPDRATRETNKLETSEAAPVYLKMNRSSNKVTVWVRGTDKKRDSQSVTFINQYADPQITGGDNQSGATGGRLPDPLEVTVKDANNRVIPSGVVVGFASTATGSLFIPVVGTTVYVSTDDTLVATAPATPDALTTTATSTVPVPAGSIFVKTDSRGVAQTYFELGDTAGPQRVTITVNGQAYNDTFFRATATNVDSTDAATITIIDGNNQRANVDDPLEDPLVVLVRDAGGRIVAGADVTFTTNSGELSAPETGDPGVYPPLDEGGTVRAITSHTTRFIVVDTDDTGRASVRYNVGDLPGAKQVFARIDVSNGRTKTKTFSINGRAASTRDDPVDADDDDDDDDDDTPTVTVNVPSSISGTAGGTATLTIRAPATARVTIGASGDTFPIGSASPGVFTGSGSSRLTLPSTAQTYTLTVFVDGTQYPISVRVDAPATGNLIITSDFEGAPNSQSTVTVRATDANQSAASGISVALSVTNRGGTFSSATVTTGTDGTATSTLTRGSTPGTNYFITARANNYDPVQSRISITGTAPPADTPPADTPPASTAGDPNLISIDGEATRSGAINQELDAPLVVEVLDSQGRRVNNARVIFRVRTGQGRLSQRGNGRATTAETNAQGTARTDYTPMSARSTVEAEVRGVTETVTFTIITDGSAPPTGTSDSETHSYKVRDEIPISLEGTLNFSSPRTLNGITYTCVGPGECVVSYGTVVKGQIQATPAKAPPQQEYKVRDEIPISLEDTLIFTGQHAVNGTIYTCVGPGECVVSYGIVSKGQIRSAAASLTTTRSTTEINPKVLLGENQRPPMLWIDGGKIYALIGTEVQEFIKMKEISATRDSIAGEVEINNALNIAIGGNKIYWTEQTGQSAGTVNSANLDGSEAKQLASIQAVPMGIAVDTANSKLYWTNSRGRIQSANLNGSGIRNVMQGSPNRLIDLSLSSNNLYFTQSDESGPIGRLYPTLSDDQMAFWDGGPMPGTPGSLAIANGKVYWTAKTGESTGAINSVNLNGSGAKQLASIQAVPMGIAVDTARSKLYWTNSRGRIQSANLDGSGIRNVVDGLGMPGDMVLSNNIKAPKATAVKSTATTAKGKYDVNGDGSVDSKDVTALIDAISLGVTASKYDVNGDGNVNILDARAVNANLDAGAAGAPTRLGMKLSAVQIERLQEQIDLLIATGDRSPSTMKLLIYLQQLIVMARPEKTQLLANYPNPFNPETWMPYELATDTEVRITIYNAQGVVIRTLQLGQQSAGYYTDRERAAYWDGRNALGEQVASGIYFYQLETDEMSSLRKMVILK